MRIAVNASSAGSGAASGGGGTYIRQLLQHLPSGHEFLVWLPASTAAEVRAGRLPSSVRLFSTTHHRAWTRVVWEQVALRRLVARHRVDVLFSPANFALWNSPVAQVLLVQNALYFSRDYERHFVSRMGIRQRAGYSIRRAMAHWSLGRADIVLYPTRAALDMAPARSRSAVNSYGSPTVRRAVGNAVPNFPVKLLFVSLYAEQKNLGTLLRAMSLLETHAPGRFRLTTTADPAWAAAARSVTRSSDLALAAQRGVARSVRFAGPVEPARAMDLYSDADLFIFPSTIESFGLPLLEAMAHGLPIVAADTPVNREVCGDAAVYFNPWADNELAAQVRRLAENPASRAALSAAAAARATQFSWREHAMRLVNAAEEALELTQDVRYRLHTERRPAME